MPVAKGQRRQTGLALLRVLIADAQPLFSAALARALAKEQRLEVIGQRPSTWVETLQTATSEKPDVALVDFWMPESQAFSPPGESVPSGAAVRAIVDSVPGLKVLVLSWTHAAEHVQAAIGAGAVSFLTKSCGLREVTEAIFSTQTGQPVVYGEQLMQLVEKLQQRQSASEELRQRFSQLTPKEVEILTQLAMGRSPKEISSELFLSLATVNARIHSMLAKIEVRSSAEVLALARRCGLIQS